MFSLLQRILGKKSGFAQCAVPHLAVFGKHPCWDDHIEDQELSSDGLVEVKKRLYSSGIASQIDSGAWETLPASSRLASFRHLFAWRLEGRTLIGVIVSSQDGKGRDKYPFVLCAELPACSYSSLPKAQEFLLGACARIHGAVSREGVYGQLRSYAADFERRFAEWESSPPLPYFQLPSRISEATPVSEVMIPSEQGVARFLYEMGNQLRGLHEGGRIVGRAHARVTACATETGPDSLWWPLVDRVVDGRTDFALFHSLDNNWVDVVVGAPEPPDFFCLRVTEAVLPRTDLIPFEMEDSVLQQAQTLLNELNSKTVS